MRIRLHPYRQGSASARALADALGGRVLRLEGSRFNPRQADVVINWGCGQQLPSFGRCRTFNGAGTAIASNKLSAFVIMQARGVSVPRFWTSREEIPEDVRWPIVCRTLLSAHSGRGIVLANSREELVAASLYVEYVPKRDEYRIHVVCGRVVVRQRKARREEVAEPNWQIRNHANGFIFARGGFEVPPEVEQQSIMAVAALGLDFGAVDVIWNDRQQRAYVLEVNTACGLEGSTVTDYANAFREEIRDV